MPEPSGTRPRQTVMPPTPMIYEREKGAQELPLRVHAAILLRVPESGIDWLDKMIGRSRELDGARGRAVSKRKR